MKYVVKGRFKDGTLDEAGIVKDFSPGDEYKGANVDALLSQGLIVATGAVEKPTPVLAEAQVAEVLSSIDEQQKPKKKGKKKGD